MHRIDTDINSDMYNILQISYDNVHSPLDRLGVVIVSVLSSNADGRGFVPGRVKPKTLKLVYAVSSLSTLHLGLRAKTGRPRVRIMCLGKNPININISRPEYA